jgi:uncharacterized protein HemX
MPTPAAPQDIAASIPIPAWEQAVIVALFVVLLIAFLGGLYFFITGILNRFQKFIIERDQQFNEAQDKRDKQTQAAQEHREEQSRLQNAAMVDAIKAQTEEIKALRTDFESHDDRTREAITRMDERTGRRKTKSDPLGGA